MSLSFFITTDALFSRLQIHIVFASSDGWRSVSRYVTNTGTTIVGVNRKERYVLAVEAALEAARILALPGFSLKAPTGLTARTAPEWIHSNTPRDYGVNMLTSLGIGFLTSILEFLYRTQVSLILVANSCNGKNECKSWFIDNVVFPLNQNHRNSLAVRGSLNRARPTPITCARIAALCLVVLIESPRKLLNSIRFVLINQQPYEFGIVK